MWWIRNAKDWFLHLKTGQIFPGGKAWVDTEILQGWYRLPKADQTNQLVVFPHKLAPDGAQKQNLEGFLIN